MCIPLAAVAIAVTVASTAASMAAASAQQSDAAKKAGDLQTANNAAAIAQAGIEYKTQEDNMRYADVTWQQDIDFASATLQYQGAEFAKQAAYVATAGQAVLKNEDTNLAQVALQAVQKNIAITLQQTNTNGQGAAARATAQVAADARGVEGNSVDSVIGDVSRQQGQTLSVMEMNRSAVNQQARIDLEATKAAGDSQLNQLQAGVKTYSPSTAIRAPSSGGIVQDPTLTSVRESSGLADSLAIGAAGVSGAVTGFNAVNTLTGTSSKDQVSGISSFLGIK